MGMACKLTRPTPVRAPALFFVAFSVWISLGSAVLTSRGTIAGAVVARPATAEVLVAAGLAMAVVLVTAGLAIGVAGVAGAAGLACASSRLKAAKRKTDVLAEDHGCDDHPMATTRVGGEGSGR